MILTLDTPDDFNLKYKDCVCYLTHNKDNTTTEELFLIEYLDDNGKTLYGYVNRGNTWATKYYKLADVDLSFHMPDLGLINHQGIVVYTARRAAKQYRRGFTWKNEVITARTVEELLQIKANNYGGLSHSAGLVHDIFDPMYYTLDSALELMVQDKQPTIAISNRYYISMSTRLPYIYLGFANGNVIGRVNENNGRCTVFKSASPLIEDLSAYVAVR